MILPSRGLLLDRLPSSAGDGPFPGSCDDDLSMILTSQHERGNVHDLLGRFLFTVLVLLAPVKNGRLDKQNASTHFWVLRHLLRGAQ
jgi:hypothetical protein